MIGSLVEYLLLMNTTCVWSCHRSQSGIAGSVSVGYGFHVMVFPHADQHSASFSRRTLESSDRMVSYWSQVAPPESFRCPFAPCHRTTTCSKFHLNSCCLSEIEATHLFMPNMDRHPWLSMIKEGCPFFCGRFSMPTVEQCCVSSRATQGELRGILLMCQLCSSVGTGRSADREYLRREPQARFNV